MAQIHSKWIVVYIGQYRYVVKEVRWNEVGEYFVIYEIEGDEERLVTTVKELDNRLVQHFERMGHIFSSTITGKRGQPAVSVRVGIWHILNI